MSPGPVTLAKSAGGVLSHWPVSDPPDFRRPGLCAWPMWGSGPDVPLDQRRLCGEPTGSPAAPYCPGHADKARGRQTTNSNGREP